MSSDRYGPPSSNASTIGSGKLLIGETSVNGRGDARDAFHSTIRVGLGFREYCQDVRFTIGQKHQTDVVRSHRDLASLVGDSRFGLDAGRQAGRNTGSK